ncbi:HAD family hydrolase [Patescibacteria group bacterium]
MKYKLLVLDVDGVLVKSKSAPVSKRVIGAIKSIRKKIKVSLCTGRVYTDLKYILDVLGINNSHHVIESGSKVLNPDGKEENIKDISFKDVKGIVELAGDFPQGYGFCVNGKWVDDINNIKKGIITTVSLHSHSQKRTKEILEKIKGIKYHIAVGSHWEIPEGNFILITNPEVSKKKALEYVQEKLGITKAETIGVGDMPNDIPLFEACGLTVAMGNGDDKLKKIADKVAPSIDDEGVAWVIKEFLK